jgi:alpha-tubulin suppressor-like RCC1 family protein
MSQLSASNIRSGVTIAGVSGSADTIQVTDVAPTNASLNDYYINSSGELHVNNGEAWTKLGKMARKNGVAKIDAAGGMTCALLENGEVYCWGTLNKYDNSFGMQLSSPTKISYAMTIEDIAVGSHNICLLYDGRRKITCIGDNDGNQASAGSPFTFLDHNHVGGNVKADIFGTTKIKKISVGGYHVCVLSEAGGVKCWGWGAEGELGNGTNLSRQISPVDVTGLTSGVVDISSGFNYNCAVLTLGEVKCWGANGHGQLGNGTTTNSNVPVDANVVLGMQKVYTSDVAAGIALNAQLHTCALLKYGVGTSNQIKCWGANGHGQLGDNTNTQRTTPVFPLQVLGMGQLQDVYLGYQYTCARTEAGALLCFGQNNYYQLGTGNSSSTYQAVTATNASNDVKDFSLSDYVTCVLKNSGKTMCWGNGNLGGGNNAQTSSSPVQVGSFDSYYGWASSL